MSNTRTFIAKESDVSLRLDKFLVYNMPEFSRSEIQKFIVKKIPDTGEIKFSDKIRLSDEVTVVIPEKEQTQLLTINKKTKFDLDILFEDDDIIVVNKPRGVAMYPGAGRETDTLVQRILSHTNLSMQGGPMRPGVVHRLDKDTSGIVIFAKSDAAHKSLTKTFAWHNLTRKYVAFVWGIPNWLEADISGNIGRSSKNRQKMTILKVGGKPAETKAEVIDAWSNVGIAKLRCTLLTGRTHQIRVHLSAHGFPVVCDPLYGRGTTRLGSVKNPELLEFIKTHHGQMLHAEVLELKHPITGEMIKFKTKLPDDMKELQEILG